MSDCADNAVEGAVGCTDIWHHHRLSRTPPSWPENGPAQLASTPEISPTSVRVLPAHDNGQRRTEAGEEAKHTPEQIIRKLRTAEQMLSKGKTVGEAAKELEVSEQTLHRWRNQYGGMKAADVKRLKELEKENGQLKRLVADKELENLALKEIAKGNF